MAAANAVSATDKIILRATTCSGSSCFSESDMITAALLHASFKIAAGEYRFARRNEIAVVEGLLWLGF